MFFLYPSSGLYDPWDDPIMCYELGESACYELGVAEDQALIAARLASEEQHVCTLVDPLPLVSYEQDEKKTAAETKWQDTCFDLCIEEDQVVIGARNHSQ